MKPTRPTDDQLADILRFTARICLEVERGLRPPDHLKRLMDPATALRWRHRDHTLGRFGGGPVHRTDLGPPRLSRLPTTTSSRPSPPAPTPTGRAR